MRGMKKVRALELLGGSVASAARSLGTSYQAISKWPEMLPGRISDRVVGACYRCGYEMPPRPELAESQPINHALAEAQETIHG